MNYKCVHKQHTERRRNKQSPPPPPPIFSSFFSSFLLFFFFCSSLSLLLLLFLCLLLLLVNLLHIPGIMYTIFSMLLLAKIDKINRRSTSSFKYNPKEEDRKRREERREKERKKESKKVNFHPIAIYITVCGCDVWSL